MNGYENGNGPVQPKGARIAFGIIMVLIYLGVGLLFIFKVGVFDFFNSDIASYIVGGLLILYGIFRGYRLYKGVQ